MRFARTIWRAPLPPDAVGVIHTDFQRGFIKARSVFFYDLGAAG